MLRIQTALTAACLALLATGCQTQTVNTTDPGLRASRPQPIQSEFIETDWSLANKAYVVDLIDGRTPQGLRTVQVSIYNPTDRPQVFMYQFEWLNRDGFTVGGQPRWITQSIAGRDTMPITGIATQRDAYDFRFKMIEPVPQN